MIKGFIFKHKENDYEIFTDFALTDEEQDMLASILMNHINDGCSIRGTLEECIEEIK